MAILQAFKGESSCVKEIQMMDETANLLTVTLICKKGNSPLGRGVQNVHCVYPVLV